MADGGAVVVELVERNLRYLNANAPTLPAAARDASPAQNARPMGTLALSAGILSSHTCHPADFLHGHRFWALVVLLFPMSVCVTCCYGSYR